MIFWLLLETINKRIALDQGCPCPSFCCFRLCCSCSISTSINITQSKESSEILTRHQICHVRQCIWNNRHVMNQWDCIILFTFCCFGFILAARWGVWSYDKLDGRTGYCNFKAKKNKVKSNACHNNFIITKLTFTINQNIFYFQLLIGHQ